MYYVGVSSPCLHARIRSGVARRRRGQSTKWTWHLRLPLAKWYIQNVPCHFPPKSVMPQFREKWLYPVQSDVPLSGKSGFTPQMWLYPPKVSWHNSGKSGMAHFGYTTWLLVGAGATSTSEKGGRGLVAVNRRRRLPCSGFTGGSPGGACRWDGSCHSKRQKIRKREDAPN